MSSPTIGSILSGFAKEAPDLIGRIGDALSAAGIPLDLGPMTPDVRAAFDKIRAEERQKLHDKFAPHEGDPGASKR